MNKWLRENLEATAPIAFHPAEEIILPSYRIQWRNSRPLRIKPQGLVIGTDFRIYCLAPRGDKHQSRLLADKAISLLKKWNEGTFFVPRYVYGEEASGPIDFIAFKNVESRTEFLPEHPEISVEVIQAIAIALIEPET